MGKEGSLRFFLGKEGKRKEECDRLPDLVFVFVFFFLPPPTRNSYSLGIRFSSGLLSDSCASSCRFVSDDIGLALGFR